MTNEAGGVPGRLTSRPQAKVNLTLEVGPREPDGLHALRSVFLRIGLSDRLSVSVAPADGSDTLVVGGPVDCPVDGNIVLRALDLLRERSGQPLPPLAVELDKTIPIGAGLGGGSSDAAAMLELAQACWGVGLSPAERLDLAHRLGSDVPFFSSGTAVALVEGSGEQIATLPVVRGGTGVLIAGTGVRLGTRAAFARYDEQSGAGARSSRSATDELAAALRAGLDGRALHGWLPRLRDANELWPAASSIAPSLAGLREGLEEHTGQPWLLTGSGSALFTLYPSAEEAALAGGMLAPPLSTRLGDVSLLATDVLGPDPLWRHP